MILGILGVVADRPYHQASQAHCLGVFGLHLQRLFVIIRNPLVAPSDDFGCFLLVQDRGNAVLVHKIVDFGVQKNTDLFAAFAPLVSGLVGAAWFIAGLTSHGKRASVESQAQNNLGRLNVVSPK